MSDVESLLERAGVPRDLSGKSVLDIGTTNGGAALEAEKRGASRVVAVDIVDPEVFGVRRILEIVGSEVELLEASVYELPEALKERFDLVFFFGVLYHLRHPLLALDKVRSVTEEFVFVETQIADHSLAEPDRGRALAEFFRLDELAADSTNWFAPNIEALHGWLLSAGFEPTHTEAWPVGGPSRGAVAARTVAGVPEYLTVSYERPLRVRVE